LYFAYLKEKTEYRGQGFSSFSFPQLMKDVWRGIRLVVCNLLWQIVYMFSILFSYTSGRLIISQPIAPFVECWLLAAFPALDYSCERTGYPCLKKALIL